MAQDVLSDGFVKLCIDTSLNFFDGKCRVLVEGQFIAGTATPDELTPVPTSATLDTLFGAGSVLSESLKKMFCQCPNNIQLFAIPRADPIGSVAAEYTLTVTGPATTDGRVELFFIDKDYSIDFHVTTGDTATDIAVAIIANLPTDFPYSASNVAGVITFVAKNAGTVGNYMSAIYNWRNNIEYPPEGVDVVFAQTVTGTGDLEPLDYDSILGNCCYTCFALLSDGVDYQTAWEDYLESKWDCNSPQCFGHGYTYVAGSLGTILARFTNTPVLSKMAHCLGDLTPPWLKVASYTALSCCTACDSPELSIQGRNYGVLNCLLIPETCDVCFTFDEQTQLQASAFVVTGPYSSGSGTYSSPYIFNDVTNNLYDDNGRPNATFRDVNSRRLAANTAVQLAEKLQEYSALALFTKNTSIKQGVFGTNPRLLLASIRAWAKDRVGILFSEFDNIDEDIKVLTDFEVKPKCQGDPSLIYLKLVYRPPVRIGKVIVDMQPKLLDNCDR